MPLCSYRAPLLRAVPQHRIHWMYDSLRLSALRIHTRTHSVDTFVRATAGALMHAPMSMTFLFDSTVHSIQTVRTSMGYELSHTRIRICIVKSQIDCLFSSLLFSS